MKKISVVSESPIGLDNYTSGQEYYLKVFRDVLRRIGVEVDFLTSKEALQQCFRYDALHLYYLNFRDVRLISKVYRGAKLVYQVYHIDDASWSRTHALSWKLFLISIQRSVDVYLATARSVYRWLNKVAPLSDHVLVEPYYECRCRIFPRISDEKFREPKQLKTLYIGRLHSHRFPLNEVIDGLKKLCKSTPVKLVIVSKIDRFDDVRSLKPCSNLSIEFMDKWLDEETKCRLYRDAHFFLYLTKGNVAMNPPITLLESVYHGTIPIVTPWILKDIEVPYELIAENINEGVEKIRRLLNDPELLATVIAKLQKSFKRFYDESRFIEAVRRTL